MKDKRLIDYIKEVHNIAKSKGWWEKPIKIEDLILLSNCELCEAVEELRKDHSPNHVYYSGKMEPDGTVTNNKPEGFPIEISDMMIRVFDYLGYICEIKGAYNWNEIYFYSFDEIIENNFEETFKKVLDIYTLDERYHGDINQKLYYLGKELFKVEKYQDLIKVIILILNLDYRFTLDLEGAMKIKIEFNRTRPYRHGKRF